MHDELEPPGRSPNPHALPASEENRLRVHCVDLSHQIESLSDDLSHAQRALHLEFARSARLADALKVLLAPKVRTDALGEHFEHLVDCGSKALFEHLVDCGSKALFEHWRTTKSDGVLTFSDRARINARVVLNAALKTE